MFIKIGGKTHYLWRAVDQQGTVLNILVTSRRDAKAATRFFHKLLKGLEYALTSRPDNRSEQCGTSAPGRGAKVPVRVFRDLTARPTCRHLLSAEGYRHEMNTRFTTWNEIIALPTAA